MYNTLASAETKIDSRMTTGGVAFLIIIIREEFFRINMSLYIHFFLYFIIIIILYIVLFCIIIILYQISIYIII